MLPIDFASLPTHETRSSPGFYSNQVIEGSDRQDPQKVAGLFEAIFYRILFQQARESAMDDDLFGGSEMNTVKEMRDNELANQLGSMGMLGIADMVAAEAGQSSSSGLLK